MWATIAMLTYAAGAVLNFRAAHDAHRQAPAWAAAYVAIAIMCILFTVFWGVIASGANLDRATWSELITPFSAAFPLVFSLPAILASQLYRQASKGRSATRSTAG